MFGKQKNMFGKQQKQSNDRRSVTTERVQAIRDDEDGLKSLLPSAKQLHRDRDSQVNEATMAAAVLEQILHECQRFAAHSPTSRTVGGVLIGEVQDLVNRDRIRIIDCISSGGRPTRRWRTEQSDLRAELNWYGRSSSGLYIAGEWQLTSRKDLERPCAEFADGYDQLNRTKGIGTSAALQLNVRVKESAVNRIDSHNPFEKQLQFQNSCFLWEPGCANGKPIGLNINRRMRRRKAPTDQPWYIQQRERFELELKVLASFANDVSASFLDDLQAVFSITDPAWLDELIVVTPNDYPNGMPIVLMRERNTDEDPRPIELEDIGIQWTTDSLLARILYALERRSAADGVVTPSATADQTTADEGEESANAQS